MGDGQPAAGPYLVLVTGPPGSGKTTLARRLAPLLGLPLVTKDDLKVILFDTIGWGDRQADRATSAAAYETMFYLAGQHVAAGQSLMLEANFRPAAAERLAAVLEGDRARCLQLRCSAPREVLARRLQHRAGTQERHPGHVDRLTVQDLGYLLSSGVVLDLPGAKLEVDTSDWAGADPQEVAARLGPMMGR